MSNKLAAATITESSGKAVEFKQEAGIFSCLFEHEIKATKADFQWQGPRFTQEQWHEMLAFFKWTYEVEKSEAQVRLFAHPTLGWKIWAFPQKGGTSMTTVEIESPEASAQRAAIGDGFVPWGTVHHHCRMGAFDSGTDKHNEKSQDGLHITIGKINDEVHDIHCRIYIKGHKFEPNMSQFWDVGQDARDKIDWVADNGFKTDAMFDSVARKQMCTTSPAGTAFNEQWKTNYIIPVRHTGSFYGSGFPGEVTVIGDAAWGGPSRNVTGGKAQYWCHHCKIAFADHKSKDCPSKKSKTKIGGILADPDWQDRKAVHDLWDQAQKEGITDDNMSAALSLLGDPDVAKAIEVIFDTCSDNFMRPLKLLETAEEMAAEEQIANKPKDETQEDADKQARITAAEQYIMGMHD